MNTQKYRWRAAFTLIELLVVISIVSLLVAILLPALGNARSAARTVKCASNLRSIGIVTHLYSNDFNNWLAPSRGTNAFFWTETLSSYLQIKRNSGSNPDEAEARRTVYTCPEDEELYLPQNGLEWVPISYAANRSSGHGSGGAATPLFKVDELKDPSKNSYFIDAKNIWYQGGTVANLRAGIGFWEQASWEPRHANGEAFNILYVDGRASPLNLDTLAPLAFNDDLWFWRR